MYVFVVCNSNLVPPYLAGLAISCYDWAVFSTKTRDWLGRTFLKWPSWCRVGRKTLTQSIWMSKPHSSFCVHVCGLGTYAGFWLQWDNNEAVWPGVETALQVNICGMVCHHTLQYRAIWVTSENVSVHELVDSWDSVDLFHCRNFLNDLVAAWKIIDLHLFYIPVSCCAIFMFVCHSRCPCCKPISVVVSCCYGVNML